MRAGDVYLDAIGSYLPAVSPVSEAVAAGRYDPDWDADDRIESVAVESRLSAPEMAVTAGRQALARSGHQPADISLLLHATIYRQGPELWASPSYVERYAVGNSAPAIEVRQGCNGGLAALDLARGHLQLPGNNAVMVTCADRFDGDFDRFRSNKGMVFGDGAAAVVVSRRQGFARIRSLATGTDPTLEEMHRGDEPLAPSARGRGTIDIAPRKRSFLRNFTAAEARRRCGEQVVGVVGEALAEAGAQLGDVARVIVSNLGHKLLDEMYLAPLGIPVERTTWTYGRRMGHLSNSDQFIALDHLLGAGELHEGDLVLIVGMGIGFTWSAAVLDVVGLPSWIR
ncbi:ketoacyl-ACP synthase III family protein [Streptomyces sp. NPDC001848]|uniref:ketoacyl-ACP synthase III family protein n=1 Tax=Streptomyces sp. NPDC001848 TaxID=3364618 RepID=UPI0036C9E6E9